MKADKILDELGIDYEFVEQDSPTKDCDDAARERGIETSQIVKSLIVERNGEVLHVCIPGDRKLSEKRFGEHKLVSPERSEELTGFESGTVHPLSSDLKHFVDERVFEEEKVSFTVGDVYNGVILRSVDFRKALEDTVEEYQVEDLVSLNEKEVQEIEETGINHEEAIFIARKGYRKTYLEIVEDFESGKVLTAFRKLNREDNEFTKTEVRKILRRAENETHIQKLAEHLSRNGELPENNSFSVEEAIEQVLEQNQEAVEDYRNGKDSALNYIMGQVMQKTKGKVDPSKAKEFVLERID